MQPTMTEGPFGFPLTDRQAIALDAILKALPKDDAFQYRKLVGRMFPGFPPRPPTALVMSSWPRA